MFTLLLPGVFVAAVLAALWLRIPSRTLLPTSPARKAGVWCPDGVFRFADREAMEAWVDVAASQRASHIWHLGNLTHMDRKTFYSELYHPEVKCLYEERLGGAMDGGKWVCDPRSLLSVPNCLVYSFGCNNNWHFERGVLETNPACEVHVFDGTMDHLEGKPDGVHFHDLNLAAYNAQPTDKAQSLMDMMKYLGHQRRRLDILKVDVEGAEYKALTPFVRSGLWQPARQVVIEVHYRPDFSLRLVGSLLRRGYFVVHAEQNLAAGICCREYSFIYLPGLASAVCGRVDCDMV